MKLWQLVHIMSGDTDLLSKIALTRRDWNIYSELLIDFSRLVTTQRRDLLDMVLNDEFVINVLQLAKNNFYLATNGWLRSWQLNENDKAMNLRDAYVEFGGDVLEEVWESGAAKVF